MTSLIGTPEQIARMRGLPEEAWFERLAELDDWSGLAASARGDLAETEAVFRAIWSIAEEQALGMPRDFLPGLEPDIHAPRVRAASPALRIIGATRLADLIDAPQPDFDMYGWLQEVREARDTVRDRLITFLEERGVFPLEPPQEATRTPDLERLAELERQYERLRASTLPTTDPTLALAQKQT